jgi:DNA-binding NarL/FixJ family response regulator
MPRRLSHCRSPTSARDVLRLVAAGNSNKQILDKLGVTEDTVKGRKIELLCKLGYGDPGGLRNILSKLGASDRTHATTIGLKRGIVQLS